MVTPVILCSRTGHMDVRAAPTSVWGSDAKDATASQPERLEACFSASRPQESHQSEHSETASQQHGKTWSRSARTGRIFIALVDYGGAMVTPLIVSRLIKPARW